MAGDCQPAPGVASTRKHRRETPSNELDCENEDPALDQSIWVYQAVQQLGEPCRTLITALFFEPTEPSYAEIAAQLGRPVGSIGPVRARCLARLRPLLECEEVVA